MSKARSERARDNALEKSFPASHPPAGSGITGDESSDKPPDQRISQDKPTGRPSRDGNDTLARE